MAKRTGVMKKTDTKASKKKSTARSVAGARKRPAGARGAAPAIRFGIGYDAHVFADELPLFIGGVEIPHERGLIGHSDADVLLHAIIDALFGAAALGDIGKHFPDNDPAFAGIPSVALLEQTRLILEMKGFHPLQIDSTILAEEPRMEPYKDQMTALIADTLGLEVADVSVKATTQEGLGWIGRGEGIAAMAVAQVGPAE